MAGIIPDPIRKIFEEIQQCVEMFPDNSLLLSALNEPLNRLHQLTNLCYGEEWIYDERRRPIPIAINALEEMGYSVNHELDLRGKVYPVFIYGTVKIALFKSKNIPH